MRIESLRLKNFKAFKDVEMLDIPGMCVLVGANGAGKSSILSVFGFLKDALTENVHVALTHSGGSRGFRDVSSRDCDGPICIDITYQLESQDSDMRYIVTIGERDGRVAVLSEILLRLDSEANRLNIFKREENVAEISTVQLPAEENAFVTTPFALRRPNTLALKVLAEIEGFPAAGALASMIENWHLSNIHIERARPEQEVGYAEHLSREGENLALVTEYLYKHHPDAFKTILDKLVRRVPGITKVDAKVTEEGRVLLRFQDGAFQDPFLARHVSDGTLKMFAYLVLLHDPKPHPLLCVEEPENQLYPKLLEELAEEFRDYANRGGQVFISTHSPDFLNAVKLDEVFWLVKEDGYSQVRRARDNEQIAAYMADGGKMGYLWKQGFFDGADPR